MEPNKPTGLYPKASRNTRSAWRVKTRHEPSHRFRGLVLTRLTRVREIRSATRHSTNRGYAVDFLSGTVSLFWNNTNLGQLWTSAFKSLSHRPLAI